MISEIVGEIEKPAQELRISLLPEALGAPSRLKGKLQNKAALAPCGT